MKTIASTKLLITYIKIFRLEAANDSPYSDSKQNTFIYTDSLSAIYAIQNFPPKDNHKLLFDILYQINKNFELQ